jgi:hypothetical protein
MPMAVNYDGVLLTEDDQLLDWQFRRAHDGAVVSGRMLCSNRREE